MRRQNIVLDGSRNGDFAPSLFGLRNVARMFKIGKHKHETDMDTKMYTV